MGGTMKHVFSVLASCIVFLAVYVQAQDFNPNPVSFIPQNQIEFKMNLPIVQSLCLPATEKNYSTNYRLPIYQTWCYWILICLNWTVMKPRGG